MVRAAAVRIVIGKKPYTNPDDEELQHALRGQPRFRQGRARPRGERGRRRHADRGPRAADEAHRQAEDRRDPGGPGGGDGELRQGSARQSRQDGALGRAGRSPAVGGFPRRPGRLREDPGPDQPSASDQRDPRPEGRPRSATPGPSTRRRRSWRSGARRSPRCATSSPALEAVEHHLACRR